MSMFILLKHLITKNLEKLGINKNLYVVGSSLENIKSQIADFSNVIKILI